MKNNPIIYLIDDSEEVRNALCWLVESIGYSVKTYDNALTFLEDFPTLSYGCIIADVRMPKMSGLELQDILFQRNSQLPIIFISGHGDIPMAVETIKKGAVDFITKPINNQDLLDAINKSIRQGAKKNDQSMQNAAVMERALKLTNREKQVAVLLTKGLSAKDLGKQLNISQHTVEVHRSNIFKKMHCKNKIELAHLVISNKLFVNSE